MEIPIFFVYYPYMCFPILTLPRSEQQSQPPLSTVKTNKLPPPLTSVSAHMIDKRTKAASAFVLLSQVQPYYQSLSVYIATGNPDAIWAPRQANTRCKIKCISSKRYPVFYNDSYNLAAFMCHAFSALAYDCTRNA